MSTTANLEIQQTDTATLKVGDQNFEMPVVEGSESERAIDIGRLRAETGLITIDEGYVNTGSTRSAITFLNGEKGILRYRGYPIEQLAAKSDFLETAYLLIYGELPDKNQTDEFRTGIREHTMIHEDMRSFYNGFPREAHPMAILSSVVGALSTFYQDSMDLEDEDQVEMSIYRLLAKLPTIAAYSYKKSIGQPFIYPNNELDYCENFLHMMFATPANEYLVDPDFSEALNLLMIVHADHEQNCSTSLSGWLAVAMQTCSLRSRRESARCGDRYMAVPMKPVSTCWNRSRRMAETSKNMSKWRKTRRMDFA